MLAESVARAVNEAGQVNVYVEGSDLGPPYIYTVGLEKTHKHPELIMFGLDAAPADHILNKVIAKIQSGEEIWAPGDGTRLINDIGLLPFAIKPADPAEVDGYVEQAWIHYGQGPENASIRFLQVVWPDAAGLFPWDEGFDARARDYQTALWK